MKLFMIIYAGAYIGGTIGPLPYGIDECEIKAAEMNAEVKLKASTLTDAKFRKIAESMRFVCEFHETRPVNNLPE